MYDKILKMLTDTIKMLYFERFDLHYQSDSLQDLTQNKTVLTIALHHQDLHWLIVRKINN
jgi:hypothetical protein